MLFRTEPRVHVRLPWRAYPKFSPPEKFLPFVLDSGGLFYLNTIENAANAMEVSLRTWVWRGIRVCTNV